MLVNFACTWPIDELAKAYCKRRRFQINRRARLAAQGGTDGHAAMLAALAGNLNVANDDDLAFNGP